MGLFHPCSLSQLRRMEGVTAQGFPDAQLGVPEAGWGAFLAHAQAAASLCWAPGLAQELVRAVDGLWADLGAVRGAAAAGVATLT